MRSIQPMAAGGCGGFRVRVAEDIRALDPNRWDAILAPDDLLATHRFVRTCQESDVEGARYRHLLVEDARGPLAIATVCTVELPLELLAPDRVRRGVRVARRALPRFLRVPVVIGGLPVSFNSSCLRIRSGGPVDRVLDLVEEVATELAEAGGAGLLCMKEFSDVEVRSLDRLGELGYARAVSLPSCRLDLPFPSFDAYVSAMRAGYRRQVRATLRVRRDRGLRVRVGAGIGDPPASELHRLYGQVMDRAEYQLERLEPGFFDALVRNLPEAETVLVEREGQLLAHALLLHGPTRSIFLLAGIDYALNREHQSYPNAVLGAVATSLERGARSLEMGQTSWALKARLGAVPTRRYLFLKHRTPLLDRLLRAGRPLLFPERPVPTRRVFRVRDAEVTVLDSGDFRFPGA